MKKDTAVYTNNEYKNKEENISSEFVVSLIKKTEKVVTALYMVTDLLPETEPIKSRVRLVSLDTISLLYSVRSRSPFEAHQLLISGAQSIDQIVSLVEISTALTFVSHMNGSILVRELLSLKEKMLSYTTGGLETVFSNKTVSAIETTGMLLSEELFSQDQSVAAKTSPTVTKALYPQHNLSFKSERSLVQKGQNTDQKYIRHDALKTIGQDEKIPQAKRESDRKDDILKIIKEKGRVGIKDISTVITDYSEKTIQRQLTALVIQGVLKKFGNKRWSTYVLNTDQTAVKSL